MHSVHYIQENDIVAIRCNNPEDLGASTFSIKLEAMSEILPLEEGHCLTIIHCPWKLAKPEEWPNAAVNNHVQYSIGKIKELVPEGIYTYYMLTCTVLRIILIMTQSDS